jgi:hypothetical protein
MGCTDQSFCLFTLVRGGDILISVIETAPAPLGAASWEPHIKPGQTNTVLSAPATTESLEVAPVFMLQAIATWGLAPWDIALTLGRR